MGFFKGLKKSFADANTKTNQELSEDAGLAETLYKSGKNLGKAMAANKDAERRESAAKKGVAFDGANYTLKLNLRSSLDECKKLFGSVGFKFKYGNYKLKEENPNRIVFERPVKGHGSVIVIFTSAGGATVGSISCGAAEFVDMLSDTLTKKLG